MKTFGLFLFLLTCLTSFVTPSRAGGPQPSGSMTVTGTVADSSGNPMSGVVIRLNDYYFVSTSTGGDGSFSLTVDPAAIESATNTVVDPANFKITANMDGYYPQTKDLVYAAGTSASHIFEIRPLPYGYQTSTAPIQTVNTEPSEVEDPTPVGTVVEPATN